MIRSRVYAIVHDRVWLIWFVALFVVMAMQQNQYLDHEIYTYNDFLRMQEDVERGRMSRDVERSRLQIIKRDYGIEAETMQAFVDEHLDTVMQASRQEVVEVLSWPVMLVPLFFVPFFLSGRALLGDQSRERGRPAWQAVLLMTGETLLLLLLLNGGTKLLMVLKWGFHARVDSFLPVAPLAWVRTLLLQPLVLYGLLLAPIQFLLCMRVHRGWPLAMTIVLFLAMALLWQVELLEFVLQNYIMRLEPLMLLDWFVPEPSAMPRVVAVSLGLTVAWTAAACVLAPRVWEHTARYRAR